MIVRPVPTWLYLIEAENGLVKIGCSKWPASRLKTVRLHCCEPTRLIAIWPGRKSDELELHGRFSAQRVHTEWFRPEGDFAAFVAEMRGHGLNSIEDWADCHYRPTGWDTEKRRKQQSESMKAAWAQPGARERWREGMRRPLRSAAYQARVREVLSLRSQGITYAEIGVRFGISRQRAEQIFKRHASTPSTSALAPAAE